MQKLRLRRNFCVRFAYVFYSKCVLEFLISCLVFVESWFCMQSRLDIVADASYLFDVASCFLESDVLFLIHTLTCLLDKSMERHDLCFDINLGRLALDIAKTATPITV